MTLGDDCHLRGGVRIRRAVQDQRGGQHGGPGGEPDSCGAFTGIGCVCHGGLLF